MDVLFVGKDEELRQAAEDVLQEDGAHLITAETVADARDMLAEQGGIRFAVLTEHLDGSPFDLYNYILEYHPDTPAVIFAASLPEDEMERRPEKVVTYSEEKIDIALDHLADLIESAVQFQADTLYPEPEDEAERLDVLNQFDFDHLEDAPFYDRLTRMGAHFFNVPMCYVGVIDRDTERFLTCHGTDFDTINRENTICSFAIIRDDVMVVDNVKADPRFSDIDALQELDLEWYASAPITVDGHRIGTFCIADTEQHEFTEDDREHLTMFADEFAEQLVHHRDREE